MDENQKKYYVLAYYHFTPIERPEEEVARHHAFFEGRDAKGRIYISPGGINGQMSAEISDAEAYMEWMRKDARFEKMIFKIHTYHENVFPRMTVKVRRQLVALDVPVDMDQTGKRLSPKAWDEMLEQQGEDTVLLDVRNDYEWKIGHFAGSELPELEQFREFPSYARKLKETRDPKKTKVMMCCTGGIRCELYSALLKQEGFTEVYQLDGGIINYGLEGGAKHWRGKLFVFDDRLAVPINETKEGEVISTCHHCAESSDVYFNCANMDCNELFLSCPACAEKFSGCCSAACQTAPRLRPYQRAKRPKPFRRQDKKSDT